MEQQRRNRTLFGNVVVLWPEALSDERPGSGGAAGEEKGEW